ncbi:MAG: tRNA pseudouridine(38-40) synthase TruA [Synergistaceae bacterium]|nr:tRNA pseudouridine(38-40) synthase TruA [Synergistota bacterium]NLM71954.1 tRNA pseudouridine(38-40) synthase TruA [Synergistaceae bacterium]
MKYAAIIGYRGTGFSGWQRQESGTGIQEKIEDALEAVTGRKTAVTAAGRTDAGVHARGQAVSFELDKEWAPDRLLLAVNYHLPQEVAFMRVARADEGFDARRSALWREYRYLIWHGNAMPPLLRGFAWWNKFHWNMEEARKACAMFEGEHDFAAFCKSSERPERTRREILRTSLRHRRNLTIFTVRGDAFMTNMVRIMGGNLQAVGYGKKDLAWLSGLLSGRDRSESAVTAPPEGLYLWRVGYGEDDPFRGDGSPIRTYGIK